jgi:hypothetical protein
MASFVLRLLKSNGIKRRIAALLQTVAAIASGSPILAPYTSILASIATYLGIGGVVQAGASKSLGLSPLSTLASFFGALLLATQNVPALMPYEPLIHSIVVILSLFATGSMVSGGKG